MEEVKSPLPVLMTPQKMELQIKGELAKKKLTVADAQSRALKIVKNEDNLKVMADLLADLDQIDELAKQVHTREKKPYLDAGKACDAGKQLVLDITATIRDSFKPDYDRLLKAVAERKRLADQKAAQDKAILKGIEDNVIVFSNLVISASDRKQLTAVEGRINLEKSPSRSKKYGEFHGLAIERYNTVLMPIIRDQKSKINALEKLHDELIAAEDANDPEKMDVLQDKITDVAKEISHNQAKVSEAALNQESFPVVEAPEVFPGVKTKRTDFTFEIADVDIALKKSRALLNITVNNKEARKVLEKLKEAGAFDDKDEVIVNGIKFVANKKLEAI